MRAHNLDPADHQIPSPQTSIAQSANGSAYQATTTGLNQMSPMTIAPAGGDQPHNNMQPYLTLNFCIALQGVYPPRT
jgi:microcystin-dependent protein